MSHVLRVHTGSSVYYASTCVQHLCSKSVKVVGIHKRVVTSVFTGTKHSYLIQCFVPSLYELQVGVVPCLFLH